MAQEYFYTILHLLLILSILKQVTSQEAVDMKIKKVIIKCVMCNSPHNLVEFKGTCICTECINHVKSES